MDNALIITDGLAEVIVLPQAGAALAAYDYTTNGERFPVFRRAPAEATAPLALSNLLLLPWQNRISRGGFCWDGKFHPMAPNLPEDRFPLHGNGFQLPWRVQAVTRERVRLGVTSDGPAPYAYTGEVEYALSGSGTLTMRLRVINNGPVLPFGLGFHPYLTRTRETYLRAPATSVTLQDADWLPTQTVPVVCHPDWDFSEPRRLPAEWINNDFSGWDGRGEVTWRDRGFACGIDATGLSRYLVYSPDSNAPSFCFEPISHDVDAFNRPGGPVEHGMIVLEHDAAIEIAAIFAPRVL